MKRLIPAAILFVIVIFILVFGNAVIRKYCKKTSEALELCYNDMKSGDEASARKHSEQLEKDFDDHKMILSVFVNHGLLDEISETLASMSSMATEEEFAHFESEYSTIKIKIHQILAESSFDPSVLY